MILCSDGDNYRWNLNDDGSKRFISFLLQSFAVICREIRWMKKEMRLFRINDAALRAVHQWSVGMHLSKGSINGMLYEMLPSDA